MHCALRFGFKAPNNEAKYEALIGGLKLTKEMKVKSLEIFRNSQLVVCQITDGYQAREEKMAAYLQKPRNYWDPSIPTQSVRSRGHKT